MTPGIRPPTCLSTSLQLERMNFQPCTVPRYRIWVLLHHVLYKVRVSLQLRTCQALEATTLAKDGERPCACSYRIRPPSVQNPHALMNTKVALKKLVIENPFAENGCQQRHRQLTASSSRLFGRRATRIVWSHRRPSLTLRIGTPAGLAASEFSDVEAKVYHRIHALL